MDAKQDYWFPKLTLYLDPYTTKHLYLYPSIQNQGTTWVRKAPVRQAASRRRRLVGRRTVRSSWRHRTRVDPRWRISWWTGHDGVWSMMAYGSSRSGCLPKRIFLPMGNYTKYSGLGKSLAREMVRKVWNTFMVISTRRVAYRDWISHLTCGNRGSQERRRWGRHPGLSLVPGPRPTAADLHS